MAIRLYSFGMRNFVQISLAIGFCIDAGAAVVAFFFFQSLLGPQFDLPLNDPALTRIADGEYVVVALVYALGLSRTRTQPRAALSDSPRSAKR